MKRALPLLLLASCAGPVELPPIYYRAPGTMTVRTVADVSRLCPGAMACTLGKGPKVVIMPDPCHYTWDFYGALLCHEQAHYLMDWTHD